MSKEVDEAMASIRRYMMNDMPGSPGSYYMKWHFDVANACYQSIKDHINNNGIELYRGDAAIIANNTATKFLFEYFDMDEYDQDEYGEDYVQFR